MLTYTPPKPLPDSCPSYRKWNYTVTIRLSTSVLLAAFLIAGCASAPTANLGWDDTEEKTQIQGLLREIFDAAEKKDLNRLDSYHLYSSKFTKFSGATLNRQDAAASRKGEHDGLASINDLKMQADDLKIDVFGEVGIATFILKSSFRAGANFIEKKDRSTMVFLKEHGAWKITHEHFSSVQPGP
jgi:ketosteroid isomerase-like protein